MRTAALILSCVLLVGACGGDDEEPDELSCEELGERLSDYAEAAAKEFAETGELPPENPDEVDLVHQFQDKGCSPDLVHLDP